MNKIRKAQKKDIEKILKLLVQVNMVHHGIRPDIFKGPATKYSAEDLGKIIKNENTPVFVSVNESDETEGYAFCIIKEVQGDILLEDYKTVYIDDLCVDESKRGKHIGSALYEYVKNFAFDIGAQSITLNVWSGNNSAQRFYEKLGMSVQRRIMEEKL